MPGRLMPLRRARSENAVRTRDRREGGFDSAELDLVEKWSKNLVRWRRRNLYFGGANAVEVMPDGTLAAAGDARRGGDGVVVG